jgi:hypothetical protein
LEKRLQGLKGKEDSLFAKSVTLTGGGVIKPQVGKYYEVWGLDQGTTSGERGVTRISPSKSRPGGEKSTGTLPNFKLQKTPTNGIIGE